MAKFDHRFQDLLAPINAAVPARTPAWFAAQSPAPSLDTTQRWDWLDDRQDSTVEVTEFAVTDGFIEALFGVAARGASARALTA